MKNYMSLKERMIIATISSLIVFILFLFNLFSIWFLVGFSIGTFSFYLIDYYSYKIPNDFKTNIKLRLKRFFNYCFKCCFGFNHNYVMVKPSEPKDSESAAISRLHKCSKCDHETMIGSGIYLE